MTMQPIETMPKDFEGFAWVACEDKDPVLVFVDEAGMAVAESLLLGEEHHEWFREELIKWWARAAAPEFPPVESDGHKCPHCGGTDIGGLMGAFWVWIDKSGDPMAEWRNLEGETEVGPERFCYTCQKEFVHG